MVASGAARHSVHLWVSDGADNRQSVGPTEHGLKARLQSRCRASEVFAEVTLLSLRQDRVKHLANGRAGESLVTVSLPLVRECLLVV